MVRVLVASIGVCILPCPDRLWRCRSHERRVRMPRGPTSMCLAGRRRLLAPVAAPAMIYVGHVELKRERFARERITCFGLLREAKEAKREIWPPSTGRVVFWGKSKTRFGVNGYKGGLLRRKHIRDSNRIQEYPCLHLYDSRPTNEAMPCLLYTSPSPRD